MALDNFLRDHGAAPVIPLSGGQNQFLKGISRIPADTSKGADDVRIEQDPARSSPSNNFVLYLATKLAKYTSLTSASLYPLTETGMLLRKFVNAIPRVCG